MIANKIEAIRNNWKSYFHRYIWPLPRFRQEMVVMVDGRMSHGGLTDRFRNILSIYDYCKHHGISFKLYYTYPSDLREILVPSFYDWRIDDGDLSSHIADSKELDLYVTPIECYPDEEHFIADNNHHHLSILDAAVKSHSHTQFHIYGNSMLANGRYKTLFEELFSPSPYLQNRINQYLSQIPEDYEAVTLRFQQLLGDFEEGNFKTLSLEERNTLINTCINKIEQLRQEGVFTANALLVTSDSPSFLHRISQIPGIYTIPGEMKHMDFTSNNSLEMNAKAFVDLYLLSKAKRITLLCTGDMYKSGFPRFAAELGGKTFREIQF